MESGNRQAHTMMRLRGSQSDASKHKPGWQAFSEFVAPLIGGAGLLLRRLVWAGIASQHQWSVLRANTCALTSGSSGPANSPLRYAFAAH